MPRKRKDPIDGTLDSLAEQRQRLEALWKTYQSAYEAAFDDSGALESVRRWRDRTARTIEQISPSEAKRFLGLFGLGAWRFTGRRFAEFCNRADTFLERRIEDVEENPDDPLYSASQEATAALLGHSTHKNIAAFDACLSYSSQDKDEARSSGSAVRKVGRTCFLAERNLKPGDKFRDEIRDALTGSKEVWVLVSPNSAKSDWVQREASA